MQSIDFFVDESDRLFGSGDDRLGGAIVRLRIGTIALSLNSTGFAFPEVG